jgi:glycosyltransferase involved in cell wall biosynthesis
MDTKMNLVVISTASLLTPPVRYGGMETESYLLVKGLEEIGHNVTLVAKHGSYSPNGGLIEVDDEKQIPFALDVSGYDAIIDMSHNKMISHAHRGENLPIIEQYQVMSMTGEGYNPVLISKGQRDEKFNGIDYPIIYQHIDLRSYPLYTGKRENYLLTMAQIIPEKRIHWSMEVALRTSIPVRIFGPQWTPSDYRVKLSEHTSRRPELISLSDDIGGEDKVREIQHARCLIHFPGDLGFVEAGSIITLEALACGTPVILSDNGVHREYVTDGVNGYIADSVEEASEIISGGGIDEIDPVECRKSVEWSHYPNMAKQYERLIERVCAGERW